MFIFFFLPGLCQEHAQTTTLRVIVSENKARIEHKIGES